MIQKFEFKPTIIEGLLEITPFKADDVRGSFIKDYSKVTHGSLIAQDIGINKIRSKCPRFNEWIEKLQNI